MRIEFAKTVLACVVSCTIAFSTIPGVQASPYLSPAFPAQAQPTSPDEPQAARLTPQQLQDLVAPIALYPDALVAQILAASAYPTQIVEAERFLQENPNLKDAALGGGSRQAGLGSQC